MIILRQNNKTGAPFSPVDGNPVLLTGLKKGVVVSLPASDCFSLFLNEPLLLLSDGTHSGTLPLSLRGGEWKPAAVRGNRSSPRRGEGDMTNRTAGTSISAARPANQHNIQDYYL